jgi:hypothetical protein
MNVRSSHMICRWHAGRLGLQGLLGLLGLLGCVAEVTSNARAVDVEERRGPGDGDVEAALCAGRPRCQLVQRQEIVSLPGSALVTTRIAEPADAESDEDHCARSEYWLARATGNLLLSADCEAQWGADNPGPAQVSLVEGRLNVRYVEFQANDNCELVEGSINLSSATVERHDRQDGVVVHDQCEPRGPSTLPKPANGDGSASRPLLVLHRS